MEVVTNGLATESDKDSSGSEDEDDDEFTLQATQQTLPVFIQTGASCM